MPRNDGFRQLFPSMTSMGVEDVVSIILLIATFVFNNVPAFYLLVVILIAYIAYVYGDFIYRSYLTLHRDLSGLYLLLVVKRDLNKRLDENRGLNELFLDIVAKQPKKVAIIDIESDKSGLYLLLVVKRDLNKRLDENRGLNELFLDIVAKQPKKVAIIDIESDKRYTFEEFNKEANKFANYFQSIGYRSGDVVALFMENSADMVTAWVGLSKIGVITAWINNNLRLEPLAHCMNTSKARSVICSKNLCSAMNIVINNGLIESEKLQVYSMGATNCDSLDLRKLLSSSSTNEPQKLDVVDFKSVLSFIYTSGTTGMPKAAIMKHFRYYSMVMGTARSFHITKLDRIYISMPLYHTAAGIIGIGQTILTGSSAVIRKKFSASNFWKDCVKYDCTASQYIGEICRYLMAQPQIPEEKQHKVRLMYGNGLRPEIWQAFVNRFGVQIGEVYGSTEGTSNLVQRSRPKRQIYVKHHDELCRKQKQDSNAVVRFTLEEEMNMQVSYYRRMFCYQYESLVNIDGRVGSCGFLPISPLTSRLHPVRLVKVDDVTGEVVRGKDGLCIPCRPGQTGAMVSTIRKNNLLLVFEGYLNKGETNKKVIYNVFRKGDSAFVSGDILHWDRLGYLYFKDRTGDTYRWKGENVSTTEVEAILHPMACVADATVYGVTVPGMEGRAGMAAVVMSENACKSKEEFLQEIGDKMASSLPSYAIPIFIRLCSSVDKTGTFKLVKTHLQKLGYRPGQADDQVFYRDLRSGRYLPLDEMTLISIDSAQFSRL
uniref:Very long-chain fatty acid transport protein n=1 Tax=Ascaris lumbricoides TaxID=6252 RepID=A0A9J2P4Z0_ASCLU